MGQRNIFCIHPHGLLGMVSEDERRSLGLLFLLQFLLPYAFIPLRLYSQRFRSGLTLAITMACALFVPGIYLIRFAFTWDSRWWLLILAVLMQAVLIVTAAKTYIPLPRLQHARLKLLGTPAYGFLLFVWFWLFYSERRVKTICGTSTTINANDI